MYVLSKFSSHGSSSDTSDADDDNKFYAKPTVSGHRDSSSAPSASDCEDLNEHGQTVPGSKFQGANATRQGDSAERNTGSRGELQVVETSGKSIKSSKKSVVQAMKVERRNVFAHRDSKDGGAQNRMGKKRLLQETKEKASENNFSKKTVLHSWSGKDEITFANALLAYYNEGPLGSSALHERVKDDLEFNFNKSQLYEKMRRMRAKYQTICAEMAEEGVGFSHRTPHEGNLFQIWKKIWGIRNAAELGADVACPKEKPGDGDEPGGKGGGYDGDRGCSGDAKPVNETGTFIGPNGGACDLLQRQIMDIMDKLKVGVQSMLEDVQLTTASLVDRSVRHAVADASSGVTNVQPPWGFEAEMVMGAGLCSILSTRMEELMNGVYSVKEFPGLDAVNAQTSQRIWRSQLIRELKLFSRRLELLHEECQMYMKDLETPINSGKS